MKKAQQRIDKILESVSRRIEDEVSGLIGSTFVLSNARQQFISKEDAFGQFSRKQVMAKLDITGDIQGQGCLLLEVKDAIRLGGTLIMLPDNMLDEVVNAETYTEDTEDSYGEIANIIAGSYTKVFEEMYPENCRFVRKTQEIIVPVKVDIDSDEPVPNQLYYQVTTAMVLNNRQMGDLVVLLPAATFGLEEDEPKIEAVAAEPPPQPVTAVAEEVESAGHAEPVVVPEPKVAKEPAPGFDVKKHRKRVDALLDVCCEKIGAEVGALLGVNVALSEQEYRLVSKEDYFLDEASGKQILAHMDVVGEIEDQSYLFVGLKDAIYIGGTLIMLPPVELEKVVIDEEFGADTQDAYGEIANIISGVYSSVFEEQYIQKVRFVKTGLEPVLPMKVETESDAPMPNQLYYMSSSSLTINDKVMGKVQMLFPAAMLQLDGLVRQEPVALPPDEKIVAPPVVTRAEGDGVRAIDVLVVSDDAREAEKIIDVLEQNQLTVQVLSFKENVTDYLPGEVKAVFLVMSNVNEKAFAVAIKIRSACSLPLIAAGQGWTRSKVITAVKYGVDDILLTPATSDDISEKIENLSIKLAA